MPRKMIDDVKVRIGTPEDLEQIMEMAFLVCKENGIAYPNVDKIVADIWPSLHQDGGLLGVIGRPGERLEGFVLLRVATLWYTDFEILEEKTVFVRPEFRSASGGRARKLCEFSKKVQQELKMPLLIGVISNQRTESKVRLYRRVFGKPAGAFFLHGIQTGEWVKEAAE
jgi:hypothetical protein